MVTVCLKRNVCKSDQHNPWTTADGYRVDYLLTDHAAHLHLLLYQLLQAILLRGKLYLLEIKGTIRIQLIRLKELHLNRKA